MRVSTKSSVVCSMFRYSLLTLFGVIAAISVGCATLVYSNELAAQCAVSTLIAGLALSTLIAVLGAGQRRRFATGFAIFAWVYVSVALSNPTTQALVAGWDRDYLLTNKALVHLHSLIFGREEKPELVPFEGAFMYSPERQKERERAENFFRIGHALFAIMLGCAGGWIARHLIVGANPLPSKRGDG